MCGTGKLVGSRWNRESQSSQVSMGMSRWTSFPVTLNNPERTGLQLWLLYPILSRHTKQLECVRAGVRHCRTHDRMCLLVETLTHVKQANGHAPPQPGARFSPMRYVVTTFYSTFFVRAIDGCLVRLPHIYFADVIGCPSVPGYIYGRKFMESLHCGTLSWVTAKVFCHEMAFYLDSTVEAAWRYLANRPEECPLTLANHVYLFATISSCRAFR